MIRLVPPRGRRSSSPKQGVQILNPIDVAIRCVDVAVAKWATRASKRRRSCGSKGAFGPAVLRTAIARLSDCCPAIAARLAPARGGPGGRACWRFRPGAICALREVTLSSDDSEAVLDHAGKILSDGGDPANADPLEFHLLHRPGGNDVVLLQYNHVLMDNRVPSRCWAGSIGSATPMTTQFRRSNGRA